MKNNQVLRNGLLLSTLSLVFLNACTARYNAEKLKEKEAKPSFGRENRSHEANPEKQGSVNNEGKAQEMNPGNHDLQNKLSDLKETEVSNQKNIEGLNQRTTESNLQLVEINKKIQSVAQTLEDSLKDQGQKIGALLNSFNQLDGRVSETQTAITASNEKINKFESKFEQLPAMVKAAIQKDFLELGKELRETSAALLNETQISGNRDRQLDRDDRWNALRQGKYKGLATLLPIAGSALSSFDFQSPSNQKDPGDLNEAKNSALKEFFNNLRKHAHDKETSFVSYTGAPNEIIEALAIQMDATTSKDASASSIHKLITDALGARLKLVNENKNNEIEQLPAYMKTVFQEERSGWLHWILEIRMNSLIKLAVARLSPMNDHLVAALLIEWKVDAQTQKAELFLSSHELEKAKSILLYLRETKPDAHIGLRLKWMLKNIKINQDESTADEAVKEAISGFNSAREELTKETTTTKAPVDSDEAQPQSEVKVKEPVQTIESAETSSEDGTVSNDH